MLLYTAPVETYCSYAPDAALDENMVHRFVAPLARGQEQCNGARKGRICHSLDLRYAASNLSQ